MPPILREMARGGQVYVVHNRVQSIYVLSDKLKQAGVETSYHSYSGVTHEFFGMDAVVADAKKAQDVARPSKK